MAEQNSINIKLALQGLSQVEAGVKQLTGVFTNLEKAVMGGSLAFGAAKVFEFAKNAAKAAGEVGSLSKKIGETTENTSRLTYATKAGAEELRTMFGHFEKWQAEHGNSDEGLIPGLLQLSSQLQAIESPAIRAQLVLDRFGKAGLDLMPFLLKGPEGIQQLFDRADRLGVVTDASAEKSKKFSQAIYDLDYAKHHLAMEIGGVFIPSLQKIVEAMTAAAVATRHFIEESPAAQHALEALAIAAAALATAISLKTVGAVTELTTATGFLARAVAVAGVAFGSFKLGEAIGQVKLFGDTIHSHLENAFLGAMHAWEMLRSKFGADNAQEIKDLEDAMLDKVLGGSGGSDNAAPQGSGNSKSKDFNLDRQKLDMKLAENKLIFERNQLETQYGLARSSQVEVLRASLRQQEQIIQQRRLLNAEQKELGLGDPLEQARRELEDKAALFQIEKQRSDLRFGDPHSGPEQMTATLLSLQREFGATAQIIANGFRDIVGGAINAVSQGIRGLIDGTMTWGDALRTIGGGVMNAIIDSIAKMAAEWLVSHILMRGISLAFSGFLMALGAKETATTLAQEAVKTPLFATNAALASVSSYGAAIAGVAALGVAIAAFAGGFKEGGYTGNGDLNAPAGIVHGQEFVMSADATARLGVPFLESLAAGREVSPFPVANQSPSKPFAVAFFDDRTKMQEWLQKQDAQKIILDTVGKNRHLFV